MKILRYVFLMTLALIVVVMVWIFFGIKAAFISENSSTPISTEQPAIVSKSPGYVGVNSCVQCHQQQVNAWQSSHHALAMQHASDNSVLGNFSQSQYDLNGVTTTFFKRNEKYYVNTDGPDGKMRDYQIQYTFGVDPLQQYLVALPGGRLQALSVAWDSRPKQQGGQQWFHLYPNEYLDHKDELHWTKLSQNWNYMCAECHSTNLKKNFDITSKRFSTTWAEINVACEACHGPASQHVDWANKKRSNKSGKKSDWDNYKNKGLVFLMDERKSVSWRFTNAADNAVRSKPRNTSKEINTCARCHSRRSTLTNNYHHGKPLMDTHLPGLLTQNTYHPDGQIKQEDYVYGSFIQSKMYHKGVTCSDCHNPHSLKLRAPANQVCLQCHKANKYETRKHHFHSLKGKGASCAECHMPASKFMVIDGRHDHSIRIPRPDLSMKMNTPNACNNCHVNKTAAWAKQQLQSWYGKDWSPGWHFGETLFDAQQGKPQAGQDLAAVALSPKIADIARATAASLLPDYLNRTTLVILPKLLADKSNMVRLAALRTVDRLLPAHRWKLAGKLLLDPILAVRIDAARVLSVVPRKNLTTGQQQTLNKALQEYIHVQQSNAEHPQSHINLGLLYLRLGDSENAKRAYQQALKLDPAYVSAYVNLADLYSLQQQHDKVEASLLRARGIIGDNAEVEHALGLHYVRSKQVIKAMQSLGKSARLRPENTRYAYVYAVALKANGQVASALSILEQAHDKHPYDRNILIALVTYYNEMGNMKAATTYAVKLVKIDPQYDSAAQILQQLRSR